MVSRVLDKKKKLFLGSLLKLKGKPYIPYVQFEHLFLKEQPLTCVLKTGRQVSKSTTVIAQSIIQALTIPRFVVLTVAPLQSQSQRLSKLFLRQFLEESRIDSISELTAESAYHYSFKNGSAIIFSYAHLDADRTRGIPADKLHVDEVQDINASFIPIMEAALSASPWKLSIFTGTPKNFNNTLQMLWMSSSQGEWAIKCSACNYWNICSVQHDLLKIIGPPDPDISFENPGTICAKCGRKINPELDGTWVHAFPERIVENAGFHVPQPIMRMHFADPVAWRVLHAKMNGGHQTTVVDFYREILGEAYDTGAQLISLNDLQKCAVLPDRNNESEIMPYIVNSRVRVFGIDWGGGGEGKNNYTTISLVCLGYDGLIYVPWGTVLYTPHDHVAEAKEIIRYCDKFNVNFVAHDFTGAGSLRETILVQSGFPRERIIPFHYVSFASAKGVTTKYVPSSEDNPRARYHLDSSRAFQFLAGAIKFGKIKFFKYDYVNESNPGLLHHFLALREEVNFPAGLKRYRIVCEDGYRDEFAQATMLGCVSIWMMAGWPNYEVE
ncbi:MAG: hypothetical protein KatS3mg087_0023 [Patescibacteria group bacterium]|nr:MAG: hypothetical protein KatS3mg087_0023 [Patescibacteria group bacterium]